MFTIFAVTTRGLESVSAAEMARIPGLRVTDRGYRRVHSTFTGQPSQLLGLRTVDDLFIHLAEWHGISPHRSALGDLARLALDLDLWQAANLRASIHSLSENPTFSVSANFVGRRNYSADEVKVAIAPSIEIVSGWRYAEDDRQSEINLRLFIEHETAWIGMRFSNSPLYKREYKQTNLPGSLKPSVAAALLMLAGVGPQSLIVDPFCGAGTILIEAAVLDARAIGGDNDISAVEAAQSNALSANVSVDIREWDGRALPLADSSVDCIVTNMPWGRQVEVDTPLAQFYADACGEMDRVLVPSGKVVILTTMPELVSLQGRCLEQEFVISLFGQQPSVLLFGPLSGMDVHD